MRLPIPIYSEDNTFFEIDIIKPKAKVLSDTQAIISKGRVYKAVSELISGCTLSLIDKEGNKVTDKLKIKRLILHYLFFLSIFFLWHPIILHPSDAYMRKARFRQDGFKLI